ncbi:MAG: hypothetical protein APF77_05585 [Clostridia bacterium BRH_c25]|nr:MAG: hypothetical protein APF77_05585 [Clostridia bacterium BRH_c25]
MNSVIFEEILRAVLQNEQIQTKNQLWECILSSNNKKYGTLTKNSMKFKGSSQFAEILKRFIQDMPNRWIEFGDVYYDGKYIANRQLLKSKVLTESQGSLLGLRLKQLEHSIFETVHEQRKNRMNKLKNFVGKHITHSYEVEEVARMLSIYESTALIKEIRKFTELNCLDLYRRLFSNKNYFYSLAKGIELPDCIEDIIDFTGENLDRDYYPMHFEILSLLFSKSRYTVLGDINQTIEKQEGLSLYDQFGRILNKKSSTLITIDKSFRCTSEILEYSAKFLDHGFKINSFSRKGDTPAVYAAHDLSVLDDMVISEIISCREKNYESIGLICKTEKDAASMYEHLKDKVDIQLIKIDGKADLRGVFIIPVYLSKGLEFDAVLICDADSDHYNTEDDKKLLYIACTRALHRLNLFYTGAVSPLL